MTEELLNFIHKLTLSSEEEMHKMGETLFYANNPTNEDICKLNRIRGHSPVLDDYEQEKIEDMIKKANLESDIL
jgi:hypothetical protein